MAYVPTKYMRCNGFIVVGTIGINSVSSYNNARYSARDWKRLYRDGYDSVSISPTDTARYVTVLFTMMGTIAFFLQDTIYKKKKRLHVA